jgi:hypothetical protein
VLGSTVLTTSRYGRNDGPATLGRVGLTLQNGGQVCSVCAPQEAVSKTALRTASQTTPPESSFSVLIRSVVRPLQHLQQELQLGSVVEVQIEIRGQGQARRALWAG